MAAGVRRHLFQSQLTRRQTPAPSSSGKTLRLESIEPQPEEESSSSEIVVRDKNGDVELGDPPTPPMDDPDEVALDVRHENESKDTALGMEIVFWANQCVSEERQRLADAVKHHQINQNSVPAEPEGWLSWFPCMALSLTNRSRQSFSRRSGQVCGLRLLPWPRTIGCTSPRTCSDVISRQFAT